MCMYFIVTFISIIALFCVMIKNKKKLQIQRSNRKKVGKITNILLERQIEILSKNSHDITLELEIGRYVKDVLLKCLEGKCTPGDAWKAHGWLRAEFQDEFQEFVDDQEEWERRRYKLMKPDQDQ